MQIITQSFFSSHCSNPEKMELQEPETNTSSRPPGIHQKLRGYYQEGVRWCLLKRKWKKTSVLVVNPTTHYSTIILLLLLIPLHSVSFFEFSVQFLIMKAKAIWCSLIDATTSSGILKAKQKLGVTFNSDKLGGIDFTKFSKLNMCSAGAGRC